MPEAGSWSVPGFGFVRPLGGGQTGNVVLAVHEASGRPVAIKYLSPDLLGRPEFVQRFRAEARALSGVTDPNVARLLDYVEAPEALGTSETPGTREAPGTPETQPSGAAIVMELVDGVTLRSVLDSRGALRPEAALVLLRGSLRGLAAAHAAGVVHRDYKPGNVMLRADGSSTLVDFGIAVPAGRGAAAEGTPWYMPPEQWAGAPLGPASDVYAATAVFFECLTGRAPYQGPELAQLAEAHRAAPIPVDQLADHVPAPVRGLVARGLAKDPAARPPSAAAFLAELEKAAHAGYGSDWAGHGVAALAGAAGATGAGAMAAFPGDAQVAPGTPTASGDPAPGLERASDPMSDGGIGTTAAHTGGRADPARTTDAGPSAPDGVGATAGQHGPDAARTGEGPGGQPGAEGAGSTAAQQPQLHREPAPVDGGASGATGGRGGLFRRWPRSRAGRSALIGGAGLGAAAIAVTTVLVVREPDPQPPPSASGATEPAATATASESEEPALTLANLCPAAEPGPADAPAVVDCVHGLTVDYWDSHGTYVTTPAEVEPPPSTYSDGSDCQTGLQLGTAFYCVGQNVAVPQALIDRQYGQLGSDGAFGLAFLVAQEMNYAVLDEAGDPVFDKDEWSVQDYTTLEQKTDCMTGVWAAQASEDGQLDLESFRGIVEQAVTVEDNYQPPPGPRADEPQTWNPVPQRMAAFDAGASGGVAACGAPALTG